MTEFGAIPRPKSPLELTGAPAGSDSAGLDAETLDTALFAWEWARMLIGSSWVADDRTVIAEQLRGLTRQLVDALEAEPFAPESGIAIGEQLVATGFDSPDALASTMTLIGQRFLRDLGLVEGGERTGPSHPERLAELSGLLCLGFVRAVRDRTLEQQEAIRSSAVLAWERAKAAQRVGALHDTLTGLLNRGGFVDRLGQLIARSAGGVVGVCLLSLDGFDALDRTLGRRVGDGLLLTVAGRLAERFSGHGDVVARVGRDEFIVAGIDGAAAGRPGSTVADRLDVAQGAIRESIVLDGLSVGLSTSCGLVARSLSQADPDQLLRDADLAASWALSRGPGSVAVFETERAARQVSDLTLTAELPAAIDQGRLLPHYQPIVSLQSGRIEAVEALARWNHAEHGLLTPDRFLHLADRGGLIAVLGRSVLRRACVQGRLWQAACVRPPVVAVNLAAAQVADPQTVRDVVTLLEETSLPAHLLQLEITEHAALDQPGTLRVIRDLARVGVSLALDDFGTGRAHLAQLPELPAHGVRTLKLPSDFLHHGGSSSASLTAARVRVFAATITLAHDLGMQVTVEGVETAEHDELVRELGADLAQGDYYAGPAPARSLDDLLAVSGRPDAGLAAGPDPGRRSGGPGGAERGGLRPGRSGAAAG